MELLEEEIIINNQPYLISTDKSKLDRDIIADYLIHQSYWASTRTVDQIKTSIEHSMCFGVYLLEQKENFKRRDAETQRNSEHSALEPSWQNEKQIAFGRVITDCTTFAYLADVFVLQNYRGQGISKALMKFILAHPQLQNLRRFVLATRDAHGLYEQFGFKALHWTERWMEIYNPTKNDPNQ